VVLLQSFDLSYFRCILEEDTESELRGKCRTGLRHMHLTWVGEI
jgi:hypothetical protein